MAYTVGAVSLGCNKNRVDTETALGLLKEKGYRLTNDPALADGDDELPGEIGIRHVQVQRKGKPCGRCGGDLRNHLPGGAVLVDFVGVDVEEAVIACRDDRAVYRHLDLCSVYEAGSNLRRPGSGVRPKPSRKSEKQHQAERACNACQVPRNDCSVL